MNEPLVVALGGRQTPLAENGELWVGRDYDLDIRTDDERVSRRHARIYRGRDGWTYEDRSSNGSFVERDRITLRLLTPGLRIRLASPIDGPLLEVTAVDRRMSARPEPVALGKRTGVHQVSSVTRIGRGPDNEITLDDLTVSRRHAQLRRIDDARFEVLDLGSHNGTFLNGARIRSGVLERGGILAIGEHLFTPGLRGLEEYVDVGRIRLQVNDLTVTVAGRRLLDGVSFGLDESSLMAIVGPTGAGKSTLLNALLGFRSSQRGGVLYGGRDLFANFDELRRRIGFVPQDDIIHTQLSARAALTYAAELRFSGDTSAAERRQRIDEVLGELGLNDRSELPINKLSGGQRKRSSVALELLTRPSLLLLDEPTSGLDPGYERILMNLFRELAQRGRTVLVVTHSLQSLEMCDRVLFLAPGGRTAFYGSPADAREYFGNSDYPNIFSDLESRRDIDWKGRFEASRFYDTNVRRRVQAQVQPGNHVVSNDPGVGWARQLWVLVRRYVAVLRADRRNFWLLLLQAPVLGVLLVSAMPENGLQQRASGNPDAHTVLMTLMISGTFLGASNAIREIVKERTIFRRERSIGLSPVAYVASKAIVLATLTVAQAFVLVGLAVLRQNGPREGLVFSPLVLELGIDIALTGLAAMAIGLIVSAFVRNPDLALTLLPVVLLTELILSGALFVLADKPVLREASYLAGSRWGFAISAATSDLRALSGCAQLAPNALPCEESARHLAKAWTEDAAVLTAVTGLGLAGAWLSVRRITPSA